VRRRARQAWPAGHQPPRELDALHPTEPRGRPAPCGTYAHLTWPAPEARFAGFRSFEWELTPELDTAQGYFWAHQFALRGSDPPGTGGYAGLQANGVYPGGPTKVAIFSIWNALDARGDGVAQPFGGEGVGFQTLVRFQWTAGRRYHLGVHALPPDAGGGHWWAGRVRDAEAGFEVEIGRIRVPEHWVGLDRWSIAWTELFSPPIRRCSHMECASSIWTDFTADGGMVRPVSVEPRFGTGMSCTNSRIATLPDGGFRQQMGLPAPEPGFA
jgi:hypothetical protein